MPLLAAWWVYDHEAVAKTPVVLSQAKAMARPRPMARALASFIGRRPRTPGRRQ